MFFTKGPSLSSPQRTAPPQSTSLPAPAGNFFFSGPRNLVSLAGREARRRWSTAMKDSSASTFSVVEDHTLANSVRFVLNQDPRVAFCGYSIRHPADNKVNIRVQTTGDPAKDVLKDALQDLMVMCRHMRDL